MINIFNWGKKGSTILPQLYSKGTYKELKTTKIYEIKILQP